MLSPPDVCMLPIDCRLLFPPRCFYLLWGLHASRYSHTFNNRVPLVFVQSWCPRASSWCPDASWFFQLFRMSSNVRRSLDNFLPFMSIQPSAISKGGFLCTKNFSLRAGTFSLRMGRSHSKVVNCPMPALPLPFEALVCKTVQGGAARKVKMSGSGVGHQC